MLYIFNIVVKIKYTSKKTGKDCKVKFKLIFNMICQIHREYFRSNIVISVKALRM